MSTSSDALTTPPFRPPDLISYVEDPDNPYELSFVDARGWTPALPAGHFTPSPYNPADPKADEHPAIQLIIAAADEPCYDACAWLAFFPEDTTLQQIWDVRPNASWMEWFLHATLRSGPGRFDPYAVLPRTLLDLSADNLREIVPDVEEFVRDPALRQ